MSLKSAHRLLDIIVGTWENVKSTRDGESWEQPYADWLTFVLGINEDGAMTLLLYGTLFGEFVQTGDYSFSMTNIIGESEGDRWYEDEDRFFIYDPETDTVYWITTSFDFTPRTPVILKIHHYFARVTDYPE